MLKKIIDYLVQDLEVQPNVAVTIILSLLTFCLGFIITWTAAGVSKWIKRRNYKRSLRVVIHNFLESCRKQYLLLEPLTKQKGFLEGENYNVFVKSNFGQHYLSSIDIKTFIDNFSSFFSKRRPQEIADFFEIVETVRAVKDTSKEQITIYQSSYDENLKKYNENLNELRKLNDEFALEYSGKNVNPHLVSYISNFASTFIKWIEGGGNKSVQATNFEIVTPLIEIAKSFPHGPHSRKIIDHCVQCRAAFENIYNVDEYMKDEIGNLRKIHKNSYDRGIALVKKW
ncbi:hypothetical protein WG954_03855 [Lacibacter sp. H375]|uniref:hypothetical protein n=1 Tax=Lacibacter sp. H375 TaxID=3133424 RepID=UPI0030C51BB7